MARTGNYLCKRCGVPFKARVADRARGWARFCSKRCKAVAQTAATGRGAPRDYYCSQCGEPARKYVGAGQLEYLCSHHAAMWEHPNSSDGLGQWQ